MNLEERLKIFKDNGYTYDHLTGYIFNSWNKICSCENNGGYIRLTTYSNNKCIYTTAHQLAWYLYYNDVPTMIDHINRIKTDNRICNLRLTDKFKNHQNQTARGYYFLKDNNKYFASINVNKKKIYLGCYSTEAEAKIAYDAAKEKYHLTYAK